MVRVSLWVPCWTHIRLIKVILVASTRTYLPSPEVASTQTYLPSPEVASTLTYLPSPEVASTLTYLPSLEVASSKKKLFNLYQTIRSYSGSHHFQGRRRLTFFSISIGESWFLCRGWLLFGMPSKRKHGGVRRNTTSVKLERKNLADLHCKFLRQHRTKTHPLP